MTLEQITTLLSLVVAVFAVIAAIVNGIRGYYFSNEYKESTESRLKEKDDHIKSLEYYSSPHLLDAYDSMKAMLEVRIGQLVKTIEQLQEINKELVEQKEELFFTNNNLTEEISRLTISQTERSILNAYTSGSSATLNRLDDLSNQYKMIRNKLLHDTKIISEAKDYKRFINTLDAIDDNDDENHNPEAPKPEGE